MSKDKLKPCPFCGGEVNIKKTLGSDERNGYNFKVIVFCQCGVTLAKPSKEDKNGWCCDNGESRTELIEQWNTRKGGSDE